MSTTNAKMSDRKLLLILVAAMVIVLLGVSVISRTKEDTDIRPSVDNSGAAGAKAVFVALGELGVNVSRWDEPLAKLNSFPPERTTLLLLEPSFSMEERKENAAALQQFMERGGRVLMTGPAWASLLPDGEVQAPGTFAPTLCYSTPEGPGELAQVGEVEMRFNGGWKAQGPQFRVEQRCMNQAVVVRFPVGKGEAIWWSSSTPITNAGLKTENNLKLVLASIGNGRQVLFDEEVQAPHARSEHLLRGLPLWWLLGQFAVAFILLVLSFSRRKGPLRTPVELPRSSPVEFATSMGDLYEKAGATGAATEAAKRRLLRMLQKDAGIDRTAVENGPEAIADSLQIRLGGVWSNLADDLRKAEETKNEPLNARSALVLVKAMREDEMRVRKALRPVSTGVSVVDGKPSEVSVLQADGKKE